MKENVVYTIIVLKERRGFKAKAHLHAHVVSFFVSTVFDF